MDSEEQRKRKAFREGQLAVACGLWEVSQTKKEAPENTEQMHLLVGALDGCFAEETLFNVCNSLVTLAVGRKTLDMNGFLEDQVITRHKIAILRAGLKSLLKAYPEESEEQIQVKRIISRVQPDTAWLVSCALLGGNFSYSVNTPNRLGINRQERRNFPFKGIPEDQRPVKQKVREGKDETTLTIVPDFRIHPETILHIYNTLLNLAETEPHATQETSPVSSVKIPLLQKVRQEHRERVKPRKEEARFFRDHLPETLQRWLQEKEENAS